MKQDIRTQLKSVDEIKNQLDPKTPPEIVSLIESQVVRARDASARIGEEGLVVRDMRGSVIAHPAIAIEVAATKLISELIGKHKKSADKRW